MDIAAVSISLPLFRYESRVRHHTPRMPTVFERTILRLHQALGANDTYNAISLHQILTDILQVVDPDPLVLPTLNGLIAMGLLHCDTDSSSLRRVALRNLQRTPLGDQMARDGFLPAVSTENLVKHTYDPIRQRFLSDRETRMLRRDKLPLALTEEVFRDAYPRDLIAADIQSTAPPWWHGASRVESIERDKTETFWDTARGVLQLSDDGELRLTFPDEKRTAYIQALDGKTSVGNVFLSILRGGAGRPAWEESLTPVDLGALAPPPHSILLVPGLSAEISGSTGLRMMRQVPGLLSAPEMPSPRTVTIMLEDAQAPPEGRLVWNNEQNGICIRLADPFPVPGYFCYDGRANCYGAGLVDLIAGSTPFRGPLGYSTSAADQTDRLQQVFTRVESLLAQSGRPEDKAIAALWGPPSRIWRALANEVLGKDGDLRAGVDRILVIRERFTALTGEEQPSGWDDAICGWFETWADHRARSLSPEHASEAATLLKRCRIRDTNRLAKLSHLLKSYAGAESDRQVVPEGRVDPRPFPSSPKSGVRP